MAHRDGLGTLSGADPALAQSFMTGYFTRESEGIQARTQGVPPVLPFDPCRRGVAEPEAASES